MNMQHQRYVRVTLTALGLGTVLLSFMLLLHGASGLRAWDADMLPDISISVLILGVLLALGGGCLVFRGMKYSAALSARQKTTYGW